MTLTPTNRMAQPEARKQGRPSKEMSDRQPSLDAVIDTTQRTVPPLIPPCCGQGNTPRLERWEVSGSNAGNASCVCQACGARFYYEPAKVRLK